MRPERGALRLPVTHKDASRAVRLGLRAAVLAAALALAGCAGDSPLAFLNPHVPDVPKVEPTAYPTLGAPDVKRMPVLTPDAQAKLQKDLETLSKDNGKSLEQAIEKGT
ncbi:hypothetical protein [Azorhizobium doebereinerae]|uniref:hypothetical protein n=1 Tax=Azorhizobium doebereinerae TaxID=281091 RepID=UPI0012EBC938|nr:hypothetical protein [Azorhizobium doebereinerae]